MLSDQYANLEQAGHSTEDRIPLARVFVDLPTFDEYRIDPPKQEDTPEKMIPGFIAHILETSSEKLSSEPLTDSVHQEYTEQSSLPKRGRYVLIGGPGQGKTTIGQFICQLFRTAILRKKNSNFSHEVLNALKMIDTQCCDTDIQLPLVPRFPFRIVLNDFASRLASKDINSVLSYMIDRIRKLTDREISTDDLRRWLAEYPWIIILDGLDEVPASSNRSDVLREISNFWIDVTDSNADILVVATTRPQGYNEDFSPKLYQHKWLAPLSVVRALHYAQRLTEIRYGKDPDRKEKILTRLDRASNHQETARLMSSPLQVTIMATLVDRMGQPPQERWNLFKEYYNVIYQREVERNIPTADVLRTHKPDIDAIHNHVGLLLQIESDRSGRTDVRLEFDRFAKLVEARLRDEEHEGDELKKLKKRIIDAATHRLVFLVGLKDNEIGFEIRSLQEFMVAEALMEGGDGIVRERLRKIAPVVNWRNVFLFAAGKCFAERQRLRDTIHTVCSELNEEDDELLQTTLAGSQLAMDLLEDGPAVGQPKYAKMLTRLAMRLLDLPPAGCHIRIADLYDPILENIYQEELKRRLIQKETVHRLGAGATLIPLIEADVPWAKDMADTYWPSSDSEKFQLLQVVANSKNGSYILFQN